MSKFVTENNIPNLKIQAIFFVGLLITFYTGIAPMFGLPTIDAEFVKEHAEHIISGVFGVATAILALVGYFKKPGQGDGVVEVKKD